MSCAGYVEAYILADYTDDVQTAAKTLVEGITWGSGSSWTAVNSGDIDLSAYAGKKVRLAFMYKSTTECAPTFEVYNIAVKEPVNGYYADVKIFKQIPESEAAMSFLHTVWLLLAQPMVATVRLCMLMTVQVEQTRIEWHYT